MQTKTKLPVRPKRAWRDVHGVLLLDKPQGLTSNDALQKARRLFSAAIGGHTGTLDPMATGLLPLCFGEATKFSADLLDADKAYETTLCLGVTTDTGDAEGEPVLKRVASCALAEVDAAIKRFVGDIQQVPPMYSALKRNGRPLYELARAGQTVDREARAIHIASIERVSDLIELGDGRQALTLRVVCSKGTYIRVLGEDIGKILGCGAHLTMLRRVQVGGLTLADAVTLSDLEAMAEPDRFSVLQPMDTLLSNFPLAQLDVAGTERFHHGNPVLWEEMLELPEGALFRVYSTEGQLLGTGQRDERNLLWPKRLLRLV
jgi:tRNA pseudouridine55 synthase